MPTKPKRTYVEFKGDRGYIDLTFSNTQALAFRFAIADFLPADMAVHQTSASAAIRIEVDGFRVANGIENEMPKVKEALAAAARLIDFYRSHREKLDAAARSATNP